MTDERIYQLMELARSYRLEGGMKLNLARLVEEEVRKEQAEKIAELERQLADAQKDSSRFRRWLKFFDSGEDLSDEFMSVKTSSEFCAELDKAMKDQS